MKQKPRSFRLSDEEQDLLLKIGEGNRTRGIRNLLRLWRAAGMPSIGKHATEQDIRSAME